MSERALFEAALEIQDPVQRSVYLDEACQGKPELRVSIDALLKAHEEAGSFLNVAAINQLKATPARPLDQTIDHSVSKTVPKDDDDEEDEYSLGFLEPSTKPGSIGKLSHYDVLQVLGKGGFGTVLKAFDEKLHRMVAIKVMDPQMAATSPPRKRFLREARAAAAIRHENIVQVYSVEEQPLPYLVMEFVDGKTLQQRQSGFGPLDIAEVLHIGRQIAGGLAAAHAMGLIHRDIKPANILLENGAEQKIKITDFGLARTADDASLTVSGMIAGTPMYMAPEQATGQTLDHRADLFSLGSVLYQITSGRPPFRAPTTVAVLRRVVEDTPRPIQEIIPEAPDWLVAIISKLHAKDPKDRFQTAKEVAELLARCQVELRNPGGERLPSELIQTITVYKQSLPSPKPSWWFSSTKNLLNFAGTLLLFVTLSAGIIWWGGELTGLPSRSLHGLLAAITGLVAIGSWGAQYLLHQRRVQEMAHFCGSVAAAAWFMAVGNGFMMAMSPKGQATIAQTETPTKGASTEPNVTTAVPAVTPAGWQGWPADAPKAAIAPFDAAQAKKHQEEWAAYLKVPVEYTNSIGMKFRLIPPGEYLRGSGAEAAQVAVARNIAKQVPPDNIASETPQHKVILTKALYLGVHEVTQGQYEQIVGKNPAWHCATGNGKDAVAGLNTKKFPIEHISWNDATEFCTKLDQREQLPSNYLRIGGTVRLLEGNGYRLPTEAEWEFACRAGTATEFWNGEDVNVVAKTAWFFDNSSLRTHAVGELAANPFGLYDMQGNVWEWCNGPWDPSEYIQYLQKTVVDPATLITTEHRAFRGGRFSGYVNDCRSATRCGAYQTFAGLDVGFRVTLSVEGVRAAIKAKSAVVESRPQSWPADAPKAANAPFDAAQAQKHQEEWAAYLKVPVEFTNSVGMKMRLIPPGEFTMGLTHAEMELVAGESNIDGSWPSFVLASSPAHRVLLTQPYYLGTLEVTQEQYEKVIGNNPSFFSPVGEAKELAKGIDTREYPVDKVNVIDAAEYCIKLSQQEKLSPAYSLAGNVITQLKGNGYRLPTEAEWEGACRAGTTTAWSHGNQGSELPVVGDRTHQTGTLKANPYGLFDMHGNTVEWCQDWYDAQAYSQRGPGVTIDPQGQITGTTKVGRGTYALHPDFPTSRSGARGGAPIDYRARGHGFRVLLSIDGARAALKGNIGAASVPTVKVKMNVKDWPADAPNPAIAPFDSKQASKHQEEWAEYLKVPVEYKNKLGMTFVLIPPGVFTMGITNEEAETLSMLKPNDPAWKQSLLANAPTRHVMISKPYYLGMYEVTQEEYEKVVGNNPSAFATNGGDKQKVVGEFTKRHPVEMVSFNDAVNFCLKLSEQDRLKPTYLIDGDNVTLAPGNGYRLPTEAQWEFACRAGTTTPWFFGNQESAIGDYAWIDRNSEGRPHFVGTVKSNPFDLFDMTGNVWEWCQDWYHPQGGMSALDPLGPETGPARILRGADWASGTIGCSSAFRGYALTGTRDRNGGFRVSLSVDAVREKLKVAGPEEAGKK